MVFGRVIVVFVATADALRIAEPKVAESKEITFEEMIENIKKTAGSLDIDEESKQKMLDEFIEAMQLVDGKNGRDDEERRHLELWRMHDIRNYFRKTKAFNCKMLREMPAILEDEVSEITKIPSQLINEIEKEAGSGNFGEAISKEEVAKIWTSQFCDTESNDDDDIQIAGQCGCHFIAQAMLRNQMTIVQAMLLFLMYYLMTHASQSDELAC